MTVDSRGSLGLGSHNLQGSQQLLRLFHLLYHEDPYEMLESAGDLYALQGRTRFSFRDYWAKRIAWTARKAQIAWWRRAAGISSRHWDPPPQPPRAATPPPRPGINTQNSTRTQRAVQRGRVRPRSPPRDVDGVAFGATRVLRPRTDNARSRPLPLTVTRTQRAPRLGRGRPRSPLRDADGLILGSTRVLRQRHDFSRSRPPPLTATPVLTTASATGTPPTRTGVTRRNTAGTRYHL
jgi:hypothetical protein